MQYFWTLQEKVPFGIGFSLYGREHLLFLCGIVLTIVLFALCYRKMSSKARRRTIQIFAWVMVVLEISKTSILLYTGQYRWNYLPLDLCGLSVYLELVSAYCRKPLLLECLYSLSLPGACLALLFPNWNKLPICNFFCLHSFLVHGILMLIPILLLSSGELRLQLRRLPFCFGCVLFLCVPLWWINQRLGTNFFFLARASKGSPLV